MLSAFLRIHFQMCFFLLHGWINVYARITHQYWFGEFTYLLFWNTFCIKVKKKRKGYSEREKNRSTCDADFSLLFQTGDLTSYVLMVWYFDGWLITVAATTNRTLGSRSLQISHVIVFATTKNLIGCNLKNASCFTSSVYQWASFSQ